MAPILVPVDFGDASFQALITAEKLAETLQCDVVIVHVTPPGAAIGEGLDSTAAHLVVDGVRDAHLVSNLRVQMADFLKRAGGRKREVLFRSGAAAAGIVAAASEVGAQLIVIASHGRRGLARIVLGSTAEEVVRHARCSVLTLKPDADLQFPG